jgi:hypothetical protein
MGFCPLSLSDHSFRSFFPVCPVMTTHLPVEARIRVSAGDPGFKNHGLCVIELTHVDSVVGMQGPRTRTPVPCFNILYLDTLNLVPAVPGAVENSASDAANDRGRLTKLLSFMSSDKSDNNNLPLWREHLAQQVVSQCPVLFEQYECPLTGKRELPVLAIENQLDVTGEGASPEERNEAALIRRAAEYVAEFDTAKEELTRLPWLADLMGLVRRNRLQLKPKDDFQRGRMYTLSQILAGLVEAVDEVQRPGMRDRLVINAAKKHAIASDNTLTYAQRKQAAVDLMFNMLEGQANDVSSSDEERANGVKWLAFLRERKASGQKLDDMADAFLLAISVALKVHKKYTKKFNASAVLACYAPVTNTDIETASLNVISTGARVAASTTKAKKPTTPKKLGPHAKRVISKRTVPIKNKKLAPAKKRKRAVEEACSPISFPSESSQDARVMSPHKKRARKDD